MENMFNKLRSTMSSAASNAVSNAVQIASQVSNYLPGNPVTREYEAIIQIGSAGRGLMWKIYKGFKKSTKEDVAIFLFEKRQLEKWDRQERDLMLDKIRNGVSQLTRLRHPQVLTVQHPLEESRETLAFATEPCFASLANVLGDHRNMPSPLPADLEDYKLFDLEIKYGLLQVSEGLNFLHNSVKIIHGNLSPENLVLNKQGAWKLFGFEFCIAASSSPDQTQPTWPFKAYDFCGPEFDQPDLDYLCPEYALNEGLGPPSDVYSYGVVVYSVFNDGRPLFRNHRDFGTFKRHCDELKNPGRLSFPNVPEVLKSEVRSMVKSNPELRPTSLQLSKSKYFDDLGVKTLSYLDQLFQWDNMQKSQFYKGLPQILPQIPDRVALHRIIPCLNKECVNVSMVPFVLPIMLQLSERVSKEEYVDHILSHLKPIMKITDPIQVMLLLMLKMELLLLKTPAEDVRTDVLPLLYRALECDTQQIQELCLSVLPSCSSLVDHPTMKNALLPRVKRLCLSTSYLSVRVNSLVCIGKMLECLDKWLIYDDIFPFLAEVPSKEAPVVMAIAGIIKIVFSSEKLGISKEILANKVLPFLFPLSIENSLTLTQYETLLSIIQQMVDKVAVEHKAKIKHLDSIRQEENSLKLAMPSVSSGNSSSPDLNELFNSIEKHSQLKQNGFADSMSGTNKVEKNRVSEPVGAKSGSSLSASPIQPLPLPPQMLPKPPNTFNSVESTLIHSNLSNLSLSTTSSQSSSFHNSMTPNRQPYIGNTGVVSPPSMFPPTSAQGLQSPPMSNLSGMGQIAGSPFNTVQSPVIGGYNPLSPQNNFAQFNTQSPIYNQNVHSGMAHRPVVSPTVNQGAPFTLQPRLTGDQNFKSQSQSSSYAPLSVSDINEFLK